MTDDAWLIVGLGNPGSRYDRTPHNLGFVVVETLARRHRLDWQNSRKWPCLLAQGAIAGARVLLMKPATYMNLSGDAAQPCAAWHQIPPQRVLPVCDDVNLPWGKIRMRENGSHGGHNGLRHLIERFATAEFPRLRIGCAPPAAYGRDLAPYVLSPIFGEALEVAPLSVEAAADCVEKAIADGPQRAMSLFNAWSASPAR